MRRALTAGGIGLDLTEHPAWSDDELETHRASGGVAALHGPLTALQQAGQSVRPDDDLTAATGLLGIQGLHPGPPQQRVGRDVVRGQHIGVSTGGSRDDDCEVVLAGGPAEGAGVDARLHGVASNGGVDAPPRQHTAVAVGDGEHPPGMGGVKDAPRPAGERGGVVDTLRIGSVDKGVRYSDEDSWRGDSTQKPLAGMLRTQGGDRL